MIVDDPEEALRLVAGGHDVVLISPADPTPTPPPAGAGRLAVMAGDPGDPEVRAAAEEMHDELFGRPPAVG